MASISPPTFPSSTRNFDPTPHKLTYAAPKFNTTSRLNHRSTYSSTLFSHPRSRVLDSTTICRCQNNNDEGNTSNNESPRSWDSTFQENFRNVIKWFDDYISGYRNQLENVMKTDDSGGALLTKEDGVVIDGNVDNDEDWDWERWKKHFTEVDKQELIVSILESQLYSAVIKEDYEEAARIKVAIAASATKDTVALVMSQLNKAIKEERYKDAAFVRDHASAGLVGWWVGFSDDSQDPYGLIVQIKAEHGRYLARSYTPRKLAKAADGDPLFEVFITMNEKGEYKHQVVYLKQSNESKDFPIASATSSTLTSTENLLDSISDKIDLSALESEDTDDFENFIRDMIPDVKDVKIKVMNVTSTEKIDRDLISKVVEQIMGEENEEEESDTELESDIEQYDIDFDIGNIITDNEGNSQIAVKIVVGDLVEKVSSDKSCKDLIRLPAKIEKKSRTSFTFLIDKGNLQDSLGNMESLKQSDGGIQDSVMVDLAKSIGSGKIPMKVLKDVNQLINLALTQGQNRQSLSRSTTFNRIKLPLTEDPLNGLYVGGHGIYTSEIIQLKRKFGQWKEDGNMKEFSNLEFYEYVEAVNITGDMHVPAGQVAFRAKVGTKYQLPHRGIIPEEFGVIARYRGQGRLAEAGFQNPKWVDGELVILDGKYINGGPVVGFVYWAPENHFLMFFNQLRLQE
ncbi:hypothetical protein L1887_40028 [Cichorium endivia]|nr:hypothetical protein L1887_40028 [Cichorium endivia]